MIDSQRRKELKSQFAQSRPLAGVFRIHNATSGKVLLASTTNLGSAKNRFDFAVAQKSAGALDQRLKRDAIAGGFEGLTFEVLESFEPETDATPEQISAELKTLEQLWREQLAGSEFY